MENLHRLFSLDRLLHDSRLPVPRNILLEKLECSPATFKRLIRVLREQYNYPIRYSRQYRGYYYDPKQAVQISGLWFSPSELQALLMIRQGLERLQPGLLSDYFDRLADRVNQLLACLGYTPEETTKRLQIVPIGHQYIRPEIFVPLSQATLQGFRVNITYRDISNRNSNRTVSPQRLIYYRNHWYLDAWCHYRKDFRIFWVAGIESVEITKQTRLSMDETALDRLVMSSYGIFTGVPTEVAHLYFTGYAARRVKNSEWHPDQRQHVHESGAVELWVPYHDSRELVMDILRYGPEVRVLGPETLKTIVIEQLKQTLHFYQQNS